jgi:hypothetical protein
MSDWSLSKLLAGLHEDIERRLEMARASFGHPGTKGNATESVWLDLLRLYLPARYQAATAHVVDSHGNFSEQIDILIFDRQYSPFVFNFEGQIVIPSESVYAAFEVKQTINTDQVEYAQKKVQTVRRLRRTSLPIPHAGGIYEPKLPLPILGGLLTFESDWNPPLGDSLLKALASGESDARLDLGCVAAHGLFSCDEAGCHIVLPHKRPATVFLFELIAVLQTIATVPMVDVRAYAKWLADPEDT